MENISQFMDYWLQPSLKTLPSYIQYTTQLLRDLNRAEVPQDTWLVTMDGKFLYTSIPHLDGIAACKEL